MGEASRKRRLRRASNWPRSDAAYETIDLQMLPPVPSIDGAWIREVTGDHSIPLSTQPLLRAFRASVGDRSFHVGFCVGGEEGFTPIGLAVIRRLQIEVPGVAVYVAPVVHEDVAWDIVLRHLRTFTGQILLFAFPDSQIYDAGTAMVGYSADIRQFGPDGEPLKRLTTADRRRIQAKIAEMYDRPAPPKLYAAGELGDEEAPWIFKLVTPSGKEVRTAVWNGRRDYAHEFPADIIRWVGGDRIAIVQVDSPVGRDLRSSVNLTHYLAKDFDGIIHWARDTQTFQSILKSFIRLDLESVAPPELPDNWEPEITMLGANGSAGEGQKAASAAS